MSGARIAFKNRSGAAIRNEPLVLPQNNIAKRKAQLANDAASHESAIASLVDELAMAQAGGGGAGGGPQLEQLKRL